MFKNGMLVVVLLCACSAISATSGEPLTGDRKLKLAWMTDVTIHMEYGSQLIALFKDKISTIKDNHPDKRDLEESLKYCEQLQKSAKTSFRLGNASEALYLTTEVAVLIDPDGEAVIKSEKFMQALYARRLELAQAIISINLSIVDKLPGENTDIKGWLQEAKSEVADKLNDNRFFYGIVMTINGSPVGELMFEGITYDDWIKYTRE